MCLLLTLIPWLSCWADPFTISSLYRNCHAKSWCSTVIRKLIGVSKVNYLFWSSLLCCSLHNFVCFSSGYFFFFVGNAYFCFLGCKQKGQKLSKKVMCIASFPGPSYVCQKKTFISFSYHRGLPTLTKYHREAAGRYEFFHHSDILSCITFDIK